MADFSTTKQALASAMKDLMNRMPFAKISIGDICDICQMNRKSFYYHFKDKYDLVNWIYDTEFLQVVRKRDMEDAWQFIRAICEYFEENKTFYRKALRIEGQNSFTSHFREVLESLLRVTLAEEFVDPETSAFYTWFYADAFCSAITRWLMDAQPLPPERFVALLQACVVGAPGARKSTLVPPHPPG